MNQALLQLSQPEGLTKKGKKRREQIIHVARQRLIKRGYDAVVLREIAEEMAASLGNIQYYFPTRRDLLAAILANEISSDLSDAVGAETSKGSPEEKLKRFCEVILARWQGDTGTLWMAMLFFRFHYDEVREISEAIYELFYEALIEIIGEINPEDSKATLRRKAANVTSLLDGANLQPKPSKAFLSRIPDLALAIVKQA